ncbi:MAG TPA: alpha/beta hydrolase, partial [Myxococcota bacterium]|nr:alpha/beta hydrolase [Myxococcota bacterium]
MIASSFRLRAADGVELFVRRFEPDGSRAVRGTVQVLHGMGEHGARYERLAQALTDLGFAVFAADCRGHGETAASPAELGFFAERDGWQRLVSDVRALDARISELQPGKPRVLLGHSMGSFLALDCLTQFGDALAAAVLSGSNGGASGSALAFRVLAEIERRRLGARAESALLRKLLFGRFNAAFEPARTAFDWLSRDPDEVAKYVADPRCGFVLTAGGFADLAGALQRLARRAVLARIPSALPIYLFGGELDPVGGRTGIGRLAAELRAAGVERVVERVYPGGRHEMLNETNRDEV